MPKSTLIQTILDPIPTWKGTEENNIPEILTVDELPPPLSGSDAPSVIDIHNAETVTYYETKIVEFKKKRGSIFDDQC